MLLSACKYLECYTAHGEVNVLKLLLTCTVIKYLQRTIKSRRVLVKSRLGDNRITHYQ